MGVLGGRKEIKRVSDTLETEMADGDMLLARANEGPEGTLVILRSCIWGWGTWADSGKEDWGGPGFLQGIERRLPTVTRFDTPLQRSTIVSQPCGPQPSRVAITLYSSPGNQNQRSLELAESLDII